MKDDLTYSQRDMLKLVPVEWERMTVGCTNMTLGALKRRGLVETKYAPSEDLVGHFHRWFWRRAPAKEALL